MCKGTANYRRDKQANAVDCEQHTNAHWGYQEEEFLENMYLYQLQRGKSETPVVAIHINGIPISLHLDTQADVTAVTEKRYGKPRSKCPLKQTCVAIRSYSGEGKDPVLPMLGKFTAALVRGKRRRKLRGVTVKLRVDTDAKGAVQKQRRVSLPLKDKFAEILDKWEKMDIIEDVGDEPTEWWSNVVLTPKKDGENIRASLDMTDANNHIKRTRHAIPTVRELETRLNGAKYISHPNMNDGYMQLELAKESRKLTTFYTHRGPKRFKRLHFGVNSAAEIFNDEIRKIVAQEPNSVSIYNDILVFGATPEEHDDALRHILKLWHEHGLTLSLKKSRLNLRAVKFFGKVFSSEGISPDPDKVVALKAAGPPQSVEEVRSFLFFVGANVDFMQGFAQATAPLRELLKANAKFQWTQEYQRSFERVREMLMSDTVMAYFDPRRKTKLKTNAGPGEMAVTMKQLDPEAKRWQPVAYRSRAFTDTESRYSQLEKEAKAVEWGIFANQIYLYGMGDTFEVDTDHKPLALLLSDNGTTSSGEDARPPTRLQLSPQLRARKERGTREDNTRAAVRLYLHRVGCVRRAGSPRTKNCSFQDTAEQSSQTSARGSPRYHQDQGIPVYQSVVSWARQNVEAHIQHCHPCQVVNVSPEREQLRMTPMPSEPWKEVALDFWGPIHTGEYLLVMVCKQSRWAEVELVTSTSARAVIPKMVKTFASLGIPVSVSSDNGPPLSSQYFGDFSKYLGFRHERKTPLIPQVNVEAEQFMRVLKKLYQISKLTGSNLKQEIYRLLRAYRAATPPYTTKIAPADLIYPGRTFCTTLPIGVVPREHNFEEPFQRDLEKKMQMKGTTAHFKKVPFRSIEEGHRWSSPKSPAKHLNESPLSTREGGPPGLEQTDKSMIETGAEESIPAEDALSNGAAAPPAWGQGARRSERHRKDPDTYLKQKYPDCQLVHEDNESDHTCCTFDFTGKHLCNCNDNNISTDCDARGDLPEPIRDMLSRSATYLSDEEERQVTQLLIKYKHVFSLSDGDVDRTSLLQHRINTGNAAPIPQTPRRTPPWKQAEVERQVTNSLDCLSGAEWFSTRDMASGFWKVTMAPETKEESAFRTTSALYQWNVMPFGLSTAPGTFERLMTLLLKWLQFKICLCYLDDIIVFSNSFTEHLTRLEEVFKELSPLT
ncbi:Retrovirus-related Pol polyprotein [Stylophora pistillata]|uniref:Retrovirus-related Pol polyprotein n=1 Tax=Stylophora pistillata TaxID=50429 RepID=A0A2B4T1U4_STYPI|nr:Retrovirus-related Pol polyprotein [Stylophora pistillata]